MPDLTEKLKGFFDPEDKHERCGLILTRNRVIETKNLHPDPINGFEVDPQAIIDNEDNLKGTWHTHPGGSSVLSGEDYTCFLNWPDLQHYVISKAGIKLYTVEDGIVLNAD